MSPASPAQRQAVGRTAEGDFHLQKLQYGAEQPGVHPRCTEEGRSEGASPARPLPRPSYVVSSRRPVHAKLDSLHPSHLTPTVTFFPGVHLCLANSSKLGNVLPRKRRKVGSIAFPSLIRAGLKSNHRLCWEVKEGHIVIYLGRP